MFNWLDTLPELSLRNLTVREAARLADNPLDLRYRSIFPRTPTESIDISEITTVDFRPVGGRRDWNAQAREVPEKFGPTRKWSMIPINYSKHIDELMLQKFGESGIQELVRRRILKGVNEWPTELADACERQLERDAFESWFTGQITILDTKSNATATVALGFDQATSYPTAGTAWNDPSEDAYENFLVAAQAAYTKFGGAVGAARTHRSVLNAIVATAPDGPNGLRPTLATLQERVREEGFANITLINDERTYDEFTDGGSATTTKYYVPEGLIGFQPADGVVGATHVAPVVRAYDFLSGNDRSLANGVVILRSAKNDGKTLMIEAQENALSMPEERRVYVVDTNIAR